MHESQPSRGPVGTACSPVPSLRRISGLLTAGLAILAVAGCGSSSSSSTVTSSSSTPASSTSSSQSAAAAQLKPIAAVAGRPGAAKAGPGTLTKLHRVAKGTGPQAHLGGLGKLQLTQAVQVVSSDLNKFWSGQFASANIQWPPMQDAIVSSSPVSTQCQRSTVAPSDPWYLCDAPNGGTFYWTIPWMQQNIATDQGGVNLAFDMAELWSFHILNLVGATSQLQSGSLPKAQWAQAAVCVTGIYVRSLSDRKLFEQGDQQTVTQFIQALSSVGGIGSPDVSSAQLQQAFTTGFKSGQPSGCGIGSGTGGGGSGTASTSTATSTTTSSQTLGG